MHFFLPTILDSDFRQNKLLKLYSMSLLGETYFFNGNLHIGGDLFMQTGVHNFYVALLCSCSTLIIFKKFKQIFKLFFYLIFNVF